MHSTTLMRNIVVAAGLSLVLATPACNAAEAKKGPDKGANEKSQPQAKAPAPPEAQPAPTTKPADDVAEIKLGSVGNTMAFSVTTMTFKTGKKVHLVLENVATLGVMKHNWVLVRPGTEAKVAADGLNAGEKADYLSLPSDDVLASTKLAGAGQTVDVTFTAPAPGTYPYICTMPGHYVVMKGALTVTP